MGYSTKWEEDYEETSKECSDALASALQTPQPKTWPISGVEGREFPDDAWWKIRPEGSN